ncbi:MAG: tetratricopeptide repeat protein [Proteobacteria bacterium]|nr:tetratricopeptide repeat protein [Pseudomonadota bacterium]MBU1711365.1 tetratricopeptide repeat protein [Pseudomonadota bacterium]
MKFTFTNSLIQRYIHFVVLSFLIIIIYYPSLNVRFIFDDYINIVFNSAVHPEKLSEIFSALHSEISGNRPLAMLSFAANFLIDDLNVIGYRVVNILIHIANTLLLYSLLALLLSLKTSHSPQQDAHGSMNHRDLAFWSAALWAVNPVQTQAVTYIVQRMTSLATLFYLAALYCFLLYKSGAVSRFRAVALILLCFILGMASKEIAITMPFAILLLGFVFYKYQFSGRHLLILFLAVSVTATVSFFLMGWQFPDWSLQYPNRNFSPWERVMTEWRVVWHYLGLFFFPLPAHLHLTYDVPISKGLFQPLTTITGLIAMLVTWIIAFRVRHRFPYFSFAILFFFLTLAVESTFLSLEIAFIHRIYLSSVFLICGIIMVLPPAAIRRLSVVFLFVLAVWSYWTIERNIEWASADILWAADVNRGATQERALNNQAAHLMDQGNFDKAIALLEEGLKTAPPKEAKNILYNLGCSYYFKGMHAESLTAFKTMVDKFGPHTDTYYWVGLNYIDQGRITAAEELAEIILTRMPDESQHYIGLMIMSLLAKEEKKYEKAEEYLKDALRTTPRKDIFPWVMINKELANLYIATGRPEQAYDIYLKIVTYYPAKYDAWERIYYMLEAGGDEEKSEVIRRFLVSEGVEIKKSANSLK